MSFRVCGIFLFFVSFLFSSEVFSSQILFSDPSGKGVTDKIETYSKNELLECSSNGDVECEYLLGILYMNGDEEWGIEKDIEKSYEILEPTWEKGVADSGYAIFSMYYHGLGVEKDHDAALEYLRKSAEMGYIISQRSLGDAYSDYKYSGLVDVDYEAAVCWYKKAADQGDRDSAGALYSMYHNGNGVDRDEDEAFKWLLIATNPEYGDPVSYFDDLAESYENGVGTSVDLVQAYKYYDLRGTAGIEGKQRVAEKMTDEEIQEAIRQSRAWQEEHQRFFPSYHGLSHQPDGSYR